MGERIFLAEDELFIALDLEATIEEIGYEVDGPHMTRAEALATLEKTDISLLAAALLDVRLADNDVFPVADRLAAAGVPILFHSGHADERMLAERYPSAAICHKPCSSVDLQATLQNIARKAAGTAEAEPGSAR